ncbi:MAG: chemotaxis protein CheB, partial [Clostridia bacterium]|nr:chemotaxis protein CheB [Clostridia bacterium]
EKVNGHCPSVDVLFESVAAVCGSKSVGIILTGMGSDGAKGLLALRNAGARTLGQDEASSVVYGMPKTAYEIGAVEKQVPLSNIPQAIIAALKI